MSRALRMGSLAAAPARHITPEILAAAAVMLATSFLTSRLTEEEPARVAAEPAADRV